MKGLGSIVVTGALALAGFGLPSLRGAAAEPSYRLALFSSGRPGTKEHAELAFWVKNGKRDRIVYRSGADDEATLTFLGATSIPDARGLAVLLPDGRPLNIFVRDDGLDVMGRETTHFRWKYEGPVNGVGMACDICLDERRSIALVRDRFTAPSPTAAPGEYPTASMRLLLETDLQGLSSDQLRLMRNEVFARHGYRFKDPALREHFSSLGWYAGTRDDVDSSLTPIERANVDALLLAERAQAARSP